MATDPQGLFDWLADQLSERTQLQPLQARGVLKQALKEGGLVAARLNKTQAVILLGQLLPQRLVRQGVANEAAEELCRDLATAVRKLKLGASDSGPLAMLGRLDRARQGGEPKK